MFIILFRNTQLNDKMTVPLIVRIIIYIYKFADFVVSIQIQFELSQMNGLRLKYIIPGRR